MNLSDEAILGKIMDMDKSRSVLRRKLQEVKDKYAFEKKELELTEPTVKLLNDLNEKAMAQLHASDESSEVVAERFKEEHKEEFDKIHEDTAALDKLNAIDYAMYQEIHAIIKEEEKAKRLDMFKRFGILEQTITD
ncbi:hypothetical protein CAOG_05702 [Capsaspora owczarzaki ATCC 30864]|uniref:hypothetical protein n=1 Tax=Capsaspora owczarzaki (strain ATCC 30864) TaxID=595528 RepID=UPI0001FE5983|nr:hypothetical protein CAOG_05702 [Capsaspora owczarzaki ATCC 30864]|eukprot:XP_004346375.1 hypothetical protein CAOG_05702 [Capsaspora owczarzaki ATCC 30864]